MSPPRLLFAGPTLARAQAIAQVSLDGLTLLPPIQRGDLPRLLTDPRTPRAAGSIILVDGLFHQALAVGHAEIRDALHSGWQVFGLSSMGAIRAREMAHLGVRGYGRVFELYCAEGDFRDDEVTLLHEPESPFRELSEPLVHIREGLRELRARGRLSDTAEADIVNTLAEMWFGERTLHRTAALLREHGLAEVEIADWLRGFDRFRVKAHDLIAFLKQRPFHAPAATSS